MPAASGRGSHGSKLRNSGCKRTISDLKQFKREWCKTVNVFSSKIIYFSPGLVWNSKQDIKVLVTAILRHICYLLNIREGKFSFSLPDDLTIEDFFFFNELYLWLSLAFIIEGKFKILCQLNEVLVAVVVILLNNLKSFRKETFFQFLQTIWMEWCHWIQLSLYESLFFFLEGGGRGVGSFSWGNQIFDANCLPWCQ